MYICTRKEKNLRTFLNIFKVLITSTITVFCSFIIIVLVTRLFVFMDIDYYEPGLIGYFVGTLFILLVLLADIFFVFRLIGYFRKGKSFLLVYILSASLILLSIFSIFVLFTVRPAMSPWHSATYKSYERTLIALKLAAIAYFVSTDDYELKGTTIFNNSNVRIGNVIAVGDRPALLYFEPEVFSRIININRI